LKGRTCKEFEYRELCRGIKIDACPC